jgi:hypothetical protein
MKTLGFFNENYLGKRDKNLFNVDVKDIFDILRK